MTAQPGQAMAEYPHQRPGGRARCRPITNQARPRRNHKGISMFVVIIDVTVKPDTVDTFRQAIFTQGENSRDKEPGCHGFDVLQDPDEPAKFTLYETYTDKATFYDVHRSTPHFAQFLAALEPIMVSMDVRELTRIWPA